MNISWSRYSPIARKSRRVTIWLLVAVMLFQSLPDVTIAAVTAVSKQSTAKTSTVSTSSTTSVAPPAVPCGDKDLDGVCDEKDMCAADNDLLLKLSCNTNTNECQMWTNSCLWGIITCLDAWAKPDGAMCATGGCSAGVCTDLGYEKNVEKTLKKATKFKKIEDTPQSSAKGTTPEIVVQATETIEETNSMLGTLRVKKDTKVRIKDDESLGVITDNIVEVTPLTPAYEEAFTDSFSSAGLSFVWGIHIWGQYALVFDTPLEVTMYLPNDMQVGMPINMLLKHGKEAPNTIWLTSNPAATCSPDGAASDPATQFMVQTDSAGRKFITFYSCRASGWGWGSGPSCQYAGCEEYSPGPYPSGTPDSALCNPWWSVWWVCSQAPWSCECWDSNWPFKSCESGGCPWGWIPYRNYYCTSCGTCPTDTYWNGSSCAPQQPSCGSATSSAPSYSAPSSNLCSIGSASFVAQDYSVSSFKWACSNSQGSTLCYAPMKVNGSCNVFDFGVCVLGNAINLNDTACGTNDTWTCQWINGGANAPCSLADPCPNSCSSSAPTSNSSACNDGWTPSSPNQAGTLVASCSSSTACDWTCSAWYGRNSSTNSCVPLSVTETCGGTRPSNTSINSPWWSSSYTKSWSTSTNSYSPASKSRWYSMTVGECNYICASGYSWDGSSCLQIIDGVCGTANGINYAAVQTTWSPYTQCAAGTPSTTSFPSPGGTRNWTCSGQNGWSASPTCTATRSAPPVNGSCGTANGKTYASSATSYGLDTQCAAGSSNNSAFPSAWGSESWTCAWSNGWSNASCSASRAAYTCQWTVPSNASLCAWDDTWLSADTTRSVANSCTTTKCEYTCDSGYTKSGNSCVQIINGACGTANGKTYASTTTSYGADTQCSAGTPSTTAFPAVWWSQGWTCQWANGWTNATTCSATRSNPPINWACDTNNVWSCTAWSAINFVDTACGWSSDTWTCQWSNGWTNASCSAADPCPINGTCGSADGVATSTAPTVWLCASGTPSPVTTETNQYTWLCEESNGWHSERCYAPRTTNSCSASAPTANSSACNDGGTPTSENQAGTLVATCSASVACDWQCASGYSKSGSTCVANSCSATSPAANSSACNDGWTPTSPSQSTTLVSSCSASVACDWSCTNGYTKVGSSCLANSCSTTAPTSNSSACNDGWTPTTYDQWGTLATSCSSSTECDWVCQSGYYKNGSVCTAYACTGTPPSNATLCAGDDTWLTANVTRTVTNTCSSTKCEYTCQSGYYNNGWVCTPYICTGVTPSNATLCAGDDTWLTVNTAKSLVSTCSATKCEYVCAGGYQQVWSTCEVEVIGLCGSAHGKTRVNAPSSNLCASGTPSWVSGTGPWTWSCDGNGGGVSCSTQKLNTPTPWTNTAAQTSITRRWTNPSGVTNIDRRSSSSSSRIARGTSTTYNQTALTCATNYGWREVRACDDIGACTSAITLNSTSTTACADNGICGYAHGKTRVNAPTWADLCDNGTAISFAGSGPWTWTCQWTNGWTNSSQCSTQKLATPTAGTPTPAQAMVTWRWTNPTGVTAIEWKPDTGAWVNKWTATTHNENGLLCATSYGSRQVRACDDTSACTSAVTLPTTATLTCLEEWVCGGADGVATPSAPTVNLCDGGADGGVTTSATWYTWTCYGVAGWGNDQCGALRQFLITWNGNWWTGHTPTSQYVTYWTTIWPFPTNPVRTNYTFSGWYTSPSGGGRGPSPITIITTTATYYAQWSGWPVNGVCGSAHNKNYSSATTGYFADTQCAAGVSTNTSFPAQWQTVTWQCQWANGGTTSEQCTATRESTAWCDSSITYPEGSVPGWSCPTGWLLAGWVNCGGYVCKKEAIGAAVCSLPPCGNGIYEPTLAEECDDGNGVNTDSCSNTCRRPWCGDGIITDFASWTDTNGSTVTVSELCDRANPLTTNCPANCIWTGIIHARCNLTFGAKDAYNVTWFDQLRTRWPLCFPVYTGIVLEGAHMSVNGIVKTWNRTCNGLLWWASSTCSLPAWSCGDGVVDAWTDPVTGLPQESCDDGNRSNGDWCSATCEWESLYKPDAENQCTTDQFPQIDEREYLPIWFLWTWTGQISPTTTCAPQFLTAPNTVPRSSILCTLDIMRGNAETGQPEVVTTVQVPCAQVATGSLITSAIEKYAPWMSSRVAGSYAFTPTQVSSWVNSGWTAIYGQYKIRLTDIWFSYCATRRESSVGTTTGQIDTNQIIAELCDNTIDDNGNGFIDCADTYCAGATNCQAWWTVTTTTLGDCLTTTTCSAEQRNALGIAGCYEKLLLQVTNTVGTNTWTTTATTTVCPNWLSADSANTNCYVPGCSPDLLPSVGWGTYTAPIYTGTLPQPTTTATTNATMIQRITTLRNAAITLQPAAMQTILSPYGIPLHPKHVEWLQYWLAGKQTTTTWSLTCPTPANCAMGSCSTDPACLPNTAWWTNVPCIEGQNATNASCAWLYGEWYEQETTLVRRLTTTGDLYSSTGAICDEGFAVSKGYFVQKGFSFSEQPNTWLDVGAFLNMEWVAVVVEGTALDDTLNQVANYQGAGKQYLFDDFITTWQKKAVNEVRVTGGPGNLNYTFLKVPTEHIYFFDGAQNATVHLNTTLRELILLGGGAKSEELATTPVTIVLPEPNQKLTIYGSLAGNAMYISKWVIRFEPASCDFTDAVEWLFVAWSGFETRSVGNRQLSQAERCKGGNLSIKGTLLGLGAGEALSVQRRSVLNAWNANAYLFNDSKTFEAQELFDACYLPPLLHKKAKALVPTPATAFTTYTAPMAWCTAETLRWANAETVKTNTREAMNLFFAWFWTYFAWWTTGPFGCLTTATCQTVTTKSKIEFVTEMMDNGIVGWDMLTPNKIIVKLPNTALVTISNVDGAINIPWSLVATMREKGKLFPIWWFKDGRYNTATNTVTIDLNNPVDRKEMTRDLSRLFTPLRDQFLSFPAKEVQASVIETASTAEASVDDQATLLGKLTAAFGPTYFTQWLSQWTNAICDGSLMVNAGTVKAGTYNKFICSPDMLWLRTNREWFLTEATSRADNIIEGSSVVIQSNPNLWSNLPPGAKAFLNSLTIVPRR